jgi:hypothetical protein
MTSAPWTPVSTRVFLAAAAAALSMLLFHQTTLQVFFWLGLAPSAAFGLGVVPPFGVPQVVSGCFWAALVGGVYGAIVRRPARRIWRSGAALGLCGLLLVWFLVLPLKGQAVAFGWQTLALIRSATASLMWGLGVALIFPRLLPRRLVTRGRSWHAEHLTA